MRIAYVCADPGIPVYGTKGASVHIQDVAGELVRRGHQVEIHAVRLGEHPSADLASVPTWTYPLPVHCSDRERAQGMAASAIAEHLETDTPDLVWERYSLFSTVLARLADTRSVRGILEVNAPLIDEQREHRRLDDEQGALANLREQVRAAAATICVSEPVRAWVEERTGTRRAHTIPNGVDTTRITPVGEEDGRVVVTFVGTLKP